MLLKKFCLPDSWFNKYTLWVSSNIPVTIIDRLPTIGIRMVGKDEQGQEYEYAANVKFVGVYRDNLYYIDTAISYRKLQVTNYRNCYSYILGGANNFKKFVRGIPDMCWT